MPSEIAKIAARRVVSTPRGLKRRAGACNACESHLEQKPCHDHRGWDLVGNNTPVFFVRDALTFSDFIQSQKRDPATGLRDNIMQRDFWSLSPESLHRAARAQSSSVLPRSVHRTSQRRDDSTASGPPNCTGPKDYSVVFPSKCSLSASASTRV